MIWTMVKLYRWRAGMWGFQEEGLLLPFSWDRKPVIKKWKERLIDKLIQLFERKELLNVKQKRRGKSIRKT